VDWTGGLDWWTNTKNHFYASYETYSKTSLIRAAWDQGVSVTKKMPVT